MYILIHVVIILLKSCNPLNIGTIFIINGIVSKSENINTKSKTIKGSRSTINLECPISR